MVSLPCTVQLDCRQTEKAVSVFQSLQVEDSHYLSRKPQDSLNWRPHLIKISPNQPTALSIYYEKEQKFPSSYLADVKWIFLVEK